MARVTKKQMLGCARRLVKDLDGQFGNCIIKKNGKFAGFKVGCWDVDYNPTYGGAVLYQIATEGGGQSQPFGSMRRKPSEFCDTTRFAQDAIRLCKKRK